MSASESNIQSRTRLAAVAKRWRLWRNNRGAFKTEGGGFVRYGLANDSKQLAAVLASGDLIGWRPVVITPDMVGKVIAQFVSVECKGTDSSTDRERLEAQHRWAALVNSEGGYAVFVNDPDKL